MLMLSADDHAGSMLRQCHCLRRSWHDVGGSQEIASQTLIDVHSGDDGAHPNPA
jgi:hypothetical protein